MTVRDEGKTQFQNGMRVAREHLEHLQDMWIAAAMQLRATVGAGKVSYGLKVEVLAPDKVKVGAGLAFDRQVRPLALEQDRELAFDFGAASALYLVLGYQLRSEALLDGTPTLLYNDVTLEARAAAPPYQDDGVVFCELRRHEAGLETIQKGAWYLPPLDHGHSGTFILDAAQRWRYDGHPLGFAGPRFDSGFVAVAPAGEARLVHGLKTTNLLVQIQARLPDGSITTRGLGQDFWYELVGDQEVRLVRSATAGNMALRAMIWPFGATGAAPVLPMADAGSDVEVEYGQPFTLDAGNSRAFDGRHLTRFIWTQFS